MVALFRLPPTYFIAATFVSTTCMVAASAALGGYRRLFRPSPKSLVVGLATAAGLYLIFLGGNLGIVLFHPLGIGASTANSIYSLIASPANPLSLQLLVLLFDAGGYESFFRGVLQRRTQPLIGGAAPFAAALADSAVHVLTLNPLWVVTTFIADAVWGLTYYYTKDLTSSVTSHLVWDILVFVILPIH